MNKKLTIRAFSGEYTVITLRDLHINMFCSKCKHWVIPDRIEFGKAHIYGLHCDTLQDIGVVVFLESQHNE